MIIVVGPVAYLDAAGRAEPRGAGARIAVAVATHGAGVQLVGKVGEDDAGEAVVLALAALGVGHVAMLREAGRPTSLVRAVDDDTLVDEDDAAEEPSNESALDAADVDLALRYLTDFAVLVLADGADPAIARVVADAATWAGARLIVVVPAAGAVPESIPQDAIVFEAPDDDPDGVFAAMVGAFAAALDDGDEPGAAFTSAVAAEGWTPAADEREEAETPA